MKGMFSAVLLMTVGLVGLSGCKSECRAYCDYYQQCLEDDIEVNDCTNKCQDASDSNENHEAKAQECADCVGSRTCAASFDDCFDDCLGIRAP